MAQESRVQNAMQEQERQFGRMTRSISGTEMAACLFASQPGTIGGHDFHGRYQSKTWSRNGGALRGLSWRLLLQRQQKEQGADGICICPFERIPTLHAGLRLDVDAERAEEQELEQGGLADTLKEIVGRTMPSPRYVRFHEAHVQRYLSRLKAFPPRCRSSLTLITCLMPLPRCTMGSSMIPCHHRSG